MKSLKERVIDADVAARSALARWNELNEAGKANTPAGQKAWDRAQKTLDRFNDLSGCGDAKPSRRGGPRPGFGGKQPGAGRKAGSVTGPRAVILSEAAVLKLDALRGTTPRSKFVEGMIDRERFCPRCAPSPCDCRPCWDCGEFPGACNC